MNARPYQERIVTEALEILRRERSVLIEMAMGTGKTFVASTLVQRMPLGRVLWVAHRIELVSQAAKALRAVTGEPIGLWTPGEQPTGQRIVVASRDTIAHKLEVVGALGFSVLVIDEAHHAPTFRYERLIEALPGAYRVGLTATPDRADKKRVRKWFAGATTPYDIPTAIGDAWLVPFHARRVRVKDVDLSGVSTTSHDFDARELDSVMRGSFAIAGMAQGIRKYQGDMPTLVYCTSIGAAEVMAEALGLHSGDAELITGTTDAQYRADAIAAFGKSYKTLVSVGVLTEGVDLPAAACVAMCRPTKSRALYAQMLGRGGRPLPGLDGRQCDHCAGSTVDCAFGRARWIAESAKPYALVLDFVGVCGRHSVVTPADIMGGSPAARAKVKRDIEAGVKTISVADAIAQEETRLARRHAQQEEKEREWALRNGLELPAAEVTAQEIGIVGLGGSSTTGAMDATAIQPSQAKKLYLMGADVARFKTSGEAQKAIGETDEVRRMAGLATLPQLELLSRYCKTDPELKRGAAQAMIVQLKRNGWRWTKGKAA